MHLLGEEAHGAAEAEAAEPAESLLRAVRKKDPTKKEPKDGQSEIVGGVDEFAKHVTLLLFLDGKMGFEGTRILQLFREIARENDRRRGHRDRGSLRRRILQDRRRGRRQVPTHRNKSAFDDGLTHS